MPIWHAKINIQQPNEIYFNFTQLPKCFG